MRFDAQDDDAPAREVPAEAHRRFRADLRARRERRTQDRDRATETHEARTQHIAAWIGAHGTADQKARHAAGLLPIAEAVEAIADEVFRGLDEQPQYVRDGAPRLQAFLRRSSRYCEVVVTADELRVSGRRASSATQEQWACLQQIQAAVPSATATLHVRDLSWSRDRKAPTLTQYSIVVVQKHGPVRLRREYDAPNAAASPMSAMPTRLEDP